ncbi:MAG: SH3 domain-containing protein [Oscillospiraceae bacterium]|nr:SH3 domain-containing protein [Oscillospiraceae bacterium]
MKKIISLMLCLVLFASLAVTVRADGIIDLGQSWDDSILAGGIYDLYAWVGDDADNYTYQWQVDVGFGDGHWYDLEDNANPYGYTGTDTYHLQFITPFGEGHIIGSGWDEIPFQCVVTDKATGLSRATPNIYMKIFASDDLEDYMAEKGVELYTPGVTGASPVTTTDDSTYYATAEAGKMLNFMCGFNPPQNDPLMGRSDLVGDVEVWITEGGKTVKRDNGGSYMPYTIGKDAVTVQFKLHYKLGIHDMGYYETKTLKLSVSEPTVVGRGTARQELSLLKEPYGQAQKLTTIPRGQSVHVHTNSGSWYQVSYNGYVGYVAGSSLNYEDYTPVIDHVQLQIAEPLAGNVWPSSISVKPDSCFATSVEWLDKTTDKFMVPGERFVKGHDYQLVVWVSAKEGYKFKLDANDKMLTTAILNDNLPCYTSRAYEQIIGKVIDIRYDFLNVKETDNHHTCKPTAIAQKNPTCTQSGQQAHYKCSCGKTYADAAAVQEVKLSTWGVIPATGHKAGGWTGNGTHHYQKCTVCREVISGTNAPHSGGEATCRQKAACTVCGLQYGRIGDHKWSPKYHAVDASGHAYQCAVCKTYDTPVRHSPGPEASETAPQKCTVCDYILAPAKNHTHTYRKVEAQNATCLTPGNLEYYICDGCSRWWLDAAGTRPVDDQASVSLPALGHFTGESWVFDDETHWQDCVVCMQPVGEGRGGHYDENTDGVCDVCGHSDEDLPVEPVTPETTAPPPADATPSADTAPPIADETKPGGSRPQWHVPVIVALFAFTAAITATILILRKKQGGEKQ